MNLNKISDIMSEVVSDRNARVSDSVSGKNANAVKDSEASSQARRIAVLSYKLRKADSLKAIKALLADSNSTVALNALANALSFKIADSNKSPASTTKKTGGFKQFLKKKMDAGQLKEFRRSLRSKLMDTESTEESVEVAKAALAETDPETVVEAVVEILSSVVEDLQGESVKESPTTDIENN